MKHHCIECGELRFRSMLVKIPNNNVYWCFVCIDKQLDVVDKLIRPKPLPVSY